MFPIVKFYSNTQHDLLSFLNRFMPNINHSLYLSDNNLTWEKEFYDNYELIDLIACFNDYSEKYKINMWISLDIGVFINVTKDNYNDLIKYIYYLLTN